MLQNEAHVEIVPGGHLLNPMGGVHCGWVLTLIDSAGGCAAHSLLPAGIGYTTVETKGNFSRPITASTGRVRAEARAVGQGRQIISAEARVLGRDGKVTEAQIEDPVPVADEKLAGWPVILGRPSPAGRTLTP